MLKLCKELEKVEISRIEKFIISYFPLSELERQTFISFLNIPDFSEFHSIFSDNVTDDEWNKTKNQIKKRFQNELFDIDAKL